MQNNPKSNPDKSLREHLAYLLKGGGAHTTFDDVIAKVPARLRGVKPKGLPHSPWMLLEHLRIAQWDILEFSRNPKHASPNWPEGYWPRAATPSSPGAWNRSVKSFRGDLKAMLALVASPRTDLHRELPWGNGQTVLREALLVADHNAYHLAQIVDVLRLQGAWREG